MGGERRDLPSKARLLGEGRNEGSEDREVNGQETGEERATRVFIEGMDARRVRPSPEASAGVVSIWGIMGGPAAEEGVRTKLPSSATRRHLARSTPRPRLGGHGRTSVPVSGRSLAVAENLAVGEGEDPV